MSLVFGISPARRADESELTGKLTNCVILSPQTAKRLAALLNRTVRNYETEFGALREKPPPSTGLGRAISKYPHLPISEDTPEKVRLLYQSITNLQVQYAYERSFKFFENTVLSNRFLLAFQQKDIREDPHEVILNICKQIEMPENYVEIFQENLPEANVVLFGFEENEKNDIYKAYLEFGSRIDEAVGKDPESKDPIPIHLAFKWDGSDNTRGTLAQYTCFPSFSGEEMMERISDVIYGSEYRKPFEIVEGVVNIASIGAHPDEFLYFEATEENNPRKSFDINMYIANLQMEQLHPLLVEMCRHYSIPTEDFSVLYEPVKNLIFGHLTGGVDREGRDFITVYFGEAGSSR